jgi:chitinase
VSEPTSGSRTATFTITLSAASSQAISVAFSTADGTALAGSDYLANSGTLTFAPGETTKTIAISVLADSLVESTETFRVLLANASNATIAVGTGTGSITDTPPVSPPPPPPPTTSPGVAVTYTTASQWNSGFVGNLGIRNTGSTPITDWTMEFELAATITNIWGAEIVSRVGNRYTIRAASWNRQIGVNQSISFGFQAATNMFAPPSGFRFNGVAV